MSDQNEEERIRRYLCGDLDAAERAALETAYLADEALFEQVCVFETELIDAYVRGRLSRADRRRFESRYLASPDQIERVAIARQLWAHVQASAAAPRASVELPGAGSGALGRLLRVRRPAWLIGAAAAILAIVWIGSVVFRSPPVTRQPPPAIVGPAPAGSAEPIRPPDKRGGDASGVVALALAPGLTRAADGGSIVSIPEAATALRLRMEHDGKPCSLYRITLRTPEGRLVWTAAGVEPLEAGRKVVAADVPADLLTSGDYVLTLSGREAGSRFEDLADYQFRVRRP